MNSGLGIQEDLHFLLYGPKSYIELAKNQKANELKCY